jgi:hypothetical protein
MTDPRNGGPVNSRSDLVPAGSVASVRCTARTSSGRPCKRWAILGGTVCPTHGGSAPQVRAAAQRRIVAAVLPNLQTAQDMIDDPEIPAATRARLLIDWFDRAGLKPVDVHAHVHTETSAQDLDEAMRRALEARGLLPETIDGDVVEDAEVVEDEDDEDPSPLPLVPPSYPPSPAPAER